MFTGLVQDRGHVEAVDQTDEGARVRVRTGLGTEIDRRRLGGGARVCA